MKLDRDNDFEEADNQVAQLSRHERYHQAIDELALAQADLIRAALDRARVDLGSQAVSQAMEALEGWSGLQVQRVDQVTADHGIWCTDVLNAITGMARGGVEELAYRDLAALANAAIRSCRPRIPERSIVGLTAALQRAAMGLRHVAHLARNRRIGAA